VDERDLALRNLTYALFVSTGRAPTTEQVAEAAGTSPAEVTGGWRRLHDLHALVLDDETAETAEIRMANPFSAVPTPHRVHAVGRNWYANCAWDALGIGAAMHVDGRIDTSCPDCGDAIRVEVRGRRPDDDTLLFHCLVPARHWWDDIVFT
jgi:hypothetical protein